MIRSILTGTCAASIILMAFAEATATSSQQASPEKSLESLNLDKSCFLKRNSPLCGDFIARKVPKINSQIWLQDLAGIFFSGSMLSGCSINKEQKDSRNRLSPSLFPGYSLSGCTFSWQHSLKTRENIDSEFQQLNFIQDSSSRLSRSKIPLEFDLDRSGEFPKISRSSLIVSLPQADSTFTPQNTKLANPAPATKRIASPFGWRRRPYSYQLQFHQGIDYGAPLGSPVVAVGDGIVTKVVSGCYDFGSLFCGGQLGNWIEIDHGNGAIGIYGHLKNSSITVQEGMKVWKNQEIAQVGSSGWSTGAHLDFRFKLNGKYEDPAKYVMGIKETNNSLKAD